MSLPAELPYDSWAALDWIAFDIESTGTDVRSDRIVTACAVELSSRGVGEQMSWLVNPEIDIPQGASDIHGITTEVAQRDGQDYAEGYAEIRNTLGTAWATDKVLVAYNGGFDLSIIHHEGLRLGYPDLEVGAVFDPFVAWRALEKYRKGKRTLTDACEAFHVPLDGAHDAVEDALAAARVAWRMLHSDFTAELAHLSVEQLMAWQAEQHRFRQEDFRQYLRSKGKSTDDVNMSWPLQL